MKLNKPEKSLKKQKTLRKEKSELHTEVQNLLRLIFDMKLIEKSVVKVGYNVKKLPLGQLSKETVLKGYSMLQEIEKELKKKNPNNDLLGKLSSKFYTFIPHDVSFSNMRNFIINTSQMLKDKLDLVQSLSDIQIAAEIVNEIENEDDDMNELDAKYKKMKCKITPIDESDPHYDTLIKTITTTHGQTHYCNIEPLQLFKIEREGEHSKFKSDIGNRKLLWHGSRFSNFGGILSQGLRIAPPEAPVTGYMFGKGVYFADMVSKSAGYCRADLSNNEGILLLCDVAWGSTNNKIHSDYNASNLPEGKHWTLGMGRWAPTKEVEIDGAMAQLGPIEDRMSDEYKKNTKDDIDRYDLRYNEFITYNIDHVEIKYLFKWKIK